jgi:hypothetical protein
MRNLILLAIFLSSTASLAIPGNNGGGNGGCGVGQTTNGCGEDNNNGNSNSNNGGYNGTINTNNLNNANTSRIVNNNDINNTIGVTNDINNHNSADFSNSSSNANSNSSSSGGNVVSGGSVNSNTVFRQASAPAIAPNVAATGNNGVSLGVQTILGGVSTGISKVDKTQKELNRANAEYSRAVATGVLVDSLLKLDQCTSDVCKKAQALVLRRLK